MVISAGGRLGVEWFGGGVLFRFSFVYVYARFYIYFFQTIYLILQVLQYTTVPEINDCHVSHVCIVTFYKSWYQCIFLNHPHQNNPLLIYTYPEIEKCALLNI